jgi:propanediol utilization protein
MGLKNNDLVDVRIDGERPMVLLGCQARVHDMFVAEMHLDTDDGNAAGIRSGATAQLLLSTRRSATN